ncbi:hypothetical protein [Chitinophaga oryziterrae]|uniref:hypothetical protein n=1 Tax=Chitinophaga oryziterrae TaxID=1031224 RepID=UPI00196B56F0|nr:hypothetical protein [Chitinophaga oryziterrae]
MKRIACLLSAISLLSLAQAQTPSNTWAVVPVTADGILNEWKTPLKYLDEKIQLAYEISNDSTNLYVAISTMDDATQVNIMRTGISLGVNIKGKKQINTSVTYPQIDGSILYAQHRYGGNNPAHQQPDDVYSGLQQYMGKAGVKGITGVPDGTVDVTQHKTGIAAALSLEKDTLNVELVIPLSKLGITPAYANKIAYSITVNQDMAVRGGSRGGGRMGGVGLGVGMGGGTGGIGGGFGVNLGSFGGRRSMDGSGGDKNSTIRVKQVLAKPEKMVP